VEKHGNTKDRIQLSNCVKEKLRVVVKHVSAPDANSRLSRAMDVLLDAAIRKNTDDKDSVKDGKKPAKMKNPLVL
jgi:hypothetical protein